MIFLGIFLSALLGIVLGGVLNVVIFRTKTGRNLFKARSTCHTCLEPIAVIDTIPVVSYVVLRGRCRTCSTAIEWQYPAIEAVMGVLATLLFLQIALGFSIPVFVHSSELFLLYARNIVMACFLLVIFVYDFRYSVILDRFSVPAILLAFLFNLALGASLLSMVLGGLLIGSFFAFQYLLSSGRWMGAGDVRMGILMGVLLGPELGLLALFVSYVLGGVAGVFLLATKVRTMHSHVPFGTFLALGTFFALLFGDALLSWYLVG